MADERRNRIEALPFVAVCFEHASGRSDRTYETGWPGRTGDVRRTTSSTRDAAAYLKFLVIRRR
ncbi:hypothetical protein [Rhizobium sp. BT-175]|uniref:hypothetical protein n=1 Tax=Rhizobium sp. BT-175 TaxID=2986929 RepID=UPI002236AA48|nr:hypothetical protein [Rhizobium sp. BT-175]MCV9945019.1 hypothetical protein [Rhizobium sp. BT-175]